MENYHQFFKDKKITIMGLGLLGRGLGDAQFLAECGAKLIVTDLKDKGQLKNSLNKLKKYKNIKYVLGEHRLEDFRKCDLVVKSADIPLDSPYIKEAKKNKIPVKMDASLFVELARKTDLNIKIIGITGTRGKSTVTHLVYKILKDSGRKVFLGGNVRGMATLPLIEKAKDGDIFVFELDSWQLQGFGEAKISPNISVFTNFMDDHLNYYKGDRKQYFKDKSNIYINQKSNDFLITIKQTKKLITKTKSRVVIASPKDIQKNWKLKIIGEHNRENVALAIRVAEIFDIKKGDIKKSVENYIGVEGRLQFVGERKGVKFYDDNNATSPDATIVALKALHNSKKKPNIILLGGGADKNLEYKKFVKEIGDKIKALILFNGTATEKIVKILPKKPKYTTRVVNSMKEAMEHTKEVAQKGDIVLLSPGAASFGVFKNEYDRGDQFIKLSKKY